MPFQYDTYHSPFVGAIGDLIRRRGEIQARAAELAANANARAMETSGAAWANAVGTIGQVVGSLPMQMAQAKRMEMQDEASRLALDRTRREAADVSALDEAFKNGDRDTILNALPGHLRPTVAKQFADADASAAKLGKLQNELKQANNDYLAGLGSSVADHGYDLTATALALQHARNTYEQSGNKEMLSQIDAIAQQIQENPNSIQQVVDGVISLSPERVKLRQAAQREAREAEQGQTRLDQGQQRLDQQAQALSFTEQARAETERHTKEQERISRLTVGRQDAAQTETARHNRAMEENARNAKIGRPVTSGDAGRLADLDTSLQLLGGIGGELGTTGAASKIGTMLPNVVTEFTGWGADSKSRQATIDKVKQIIGKALEGGVLRKEDEIKYSKILPQIGDPPDVAKAKIKGLEQTLKDKRQNTLDALSDAGYDVSRFAAREPKSTVPTEVSTALKGQKPGRYTLSDGSKWVVDADGNVTKGS